MKRRKIFIVSHSSMDLLSTLNQYERNKHLCDVVLIVSATLENLQFLQAIAVPSHIIRFLNFKSRRVDRRRGTVRLVAQMCEERRLLDELAAEITLRSDNELIFHSSYGDPHIGYLVSRVISKIRVTLVDLLDYTHPRLKLHQLISWAGVRNIGYWALASLVFGRLFKLCGMRSHPMLSLDPERVRVRRLTKSTAGSIRTLERYRCRPSVRGKIAIFLYSESFGVGEQRHIRVYAEMAERLIELGFKVLIKVHPQSGHPTFLDKYCDGYIPTYVPFEFVDLTGVSLVVGLSSAALLCTHDVPTVSMLKMVYEEGTDYYDVAMTQMSRHSAIKYVRSTHEFRDLLSLHWPKLLPN